MDAYEPRLATAAKHVFKDAYEYTEKYRTFVKEQKALEKQKKNELLRKQE